MRKLSLLLCLGASLLLTGCQSTRTSEALGPEFQELLKQAQQHEAACKMRQFKTATAYMKCLNEADAVVLPALTPQLSNAWQLRMARRMALAERIDSKEIKTATQMEIEFREINAQTMSDLDRILGR